jgi:hypothetical protein
MGGARERRGRVAGVGDVGIGAMHPSIARARQLLDRDVEQREGIDVPNENINPMEEWAASMPDVGDRQRFAEWLARQPQMADPVDNCRNEKSVTTVSAFAPTDYQRAYARQVEQDQRVAEQIERAIEAEHRVMIEAVAEFVSTYVAPLRAEINKLRGEPMQWPPDDLLSKAYPREVA